MSVTPTEQRVATFKLTQLVWLLFGLLEALIALRVVLKLIGANANNAFASLVYGLSNVFLWPFFGLTGTPAANGMVLEIPSIIAMIVYALVAWAVARVVWLLLYRPRETEVVQETVVTSTNREP
jgi:YggT family protein